MRAPSENGSCGSLNSSYVSHAIDVDPFRRSQSLQTLGRKRTNRRVSAAAKLHTPPQVRFSTKLLETGVTDEDESGVQEKSTRLAFFTPVNILVLVLMAGLVVASVLLPLQVWQEAVDTHNARLADSFEAVADSHAQGLREALESIASRMLQYDAFLQQIRTLDSLRAFASRDHEFSATVMWLPHVLHSERESFVDETTATYRSFFNDSTFTMNVTDLVFTDGVATGVTVAPPKPEYFPVQFMANTDIHPLVPGIDLNSEPTRAHVLAQARATRELATSSRIFSVTDSSASSFLTRPVYEATNASHLLGMLAIGIHPTEMVRDAVNELPAASIRLRIFDVTAEFADETGCVKPLLFDGERDGSSGAWESSPIDLSYCPSNPLELAGDGAVTATATIGQLEWLFIFERGATFDDTGTSVSLRLVVQSAVLASLTALVIVGVLARGWWMMDVLRESQQRELKASRQSKSFLSFVTHELRNPLFALMGTAGELSAVVDEEQCSSNVVSLISSIEVSAERMSTILDDVLSMRKLEEGKLELDVSPTSLKDVARELHAMFSPRAKASGVKLRSFVRRDLPSVLMDSGRVVQVLSNFLSNAIKFTQRGGLVELHIRAVDEPDWYNGEQDRHTGKKAQDRSKSNSPAAVHPTPSPDDSEKTAFVCVEVRDSGKGISDEEMSRLFQPYVQASAKTARTHGGTGLGLYISKQLVESMGGELAVTSCPGKGSTFSAIIPLEVVPGASPVPRAPASARDEQGSNLSANTSMQVLLTSHTKGAGMPRISSLLADDEARLTPQSRSHVTQLSQNLSEIAEGVRDDTMEFPAVLQDSETFPNVEPQPIQLLQGGQEQAPVVLIVDDQDINRRILGNLFNRFLPSFKVRYAEDGAEALGEVKRRADEYLLVLMDVVMPVMDGRESVREMRACGLDLPVVAVTGGVSQEEMDANWEAGFSEVVVKPLRRAQLLGLVSKYLRIRSAVASAQQSS